MGKNEPVFLPNGPLGWTLLFKVDVFDHAYSTFFVSQSICIYRNKAESININQGPQPTLNTKILWLNVIITHS